MREDVIALIRLCRAEGVRVAYTGDVQYIIGAAADMGLMNANESWSMNDWYKSLPYPDQLEIIRESS